MPVISRIVSIALRVAQLAFAAVSLTQTSSLLAKN